MPAKAVFMKCVIINCQLAQAKNSLEKHSIIVLLKQINQVLKEQRKYLLIKEKAFKRFSLQVALAVVQTYSICQLRY